MMSPASALHDPVFRNYLIIVPASLICGGVVLAVIEYGLRKRLGSIWATYRSWILMAAIGLSCVWAGRSAVILGITVLSIFAFREFARASGLKSDHWLTTVIYCGIAVAGSASLMRCPNCDPPAFGWYGLFMTLPILGIAAIVCVPILRNRATGQVEKVGFGIIGLLCIGWMFGHLGYLANSARAYGYVCFLIFATELTDISGFIFGRLFGRHSLRSQISPRKTVEGAVGAVAVGMALPWILRFSFPFFGPTQLILTGLIVGLGGLIGDLSVSLIKRDFGLKDMSAAIPGHGGILDRIDSLIFVAPLFMHMVNHYYGLR